MNYLEFFDILIIGYCFVCGITIVLFDILILDAGHNKITSTLLMMMRTRANTWILPSS